MSLKQYYFKCIEELNRENYELEANCSSCIHNVHHISGIEYRKCEVLSEHIGGGYYGNDFFRIIDDDFYCGYYKTK